MEPTQEYRREEVTTTTTFNRDGAVKLAQNMWRDFGPLIVGALVLILVLVGGWTLFKKSQTGSEPQDVVLDTQTSGTDIVLPESTINLSSNPSPAPIGGGDVAPSPSPTPTPTPTATPSALAKGETPGSAPQVSTEAGMTKGGKLPQTGPEMFILTGSGAALASGLYLLRRNR